MKRQIIKIDEELCNGCGICVDGCHEGALQLIEGKARLVSELFCDGLGACIGECPEGAIEIEEREAEEYDEIQVIDRMLPKGMGVIKAHLKHLHTHGQHEFVKQGLKRLTEKGVQMDLSFLNPAETHTHHSGCPGSASRVFEQSSGNNNETGDVSSKLAQWPIQLHLINPSMPMFDGKDLLLAADCVPFAMGDFHNKLLAGKMLAVACPKLDSGKEIYVEKISSLIDDRKINTLTVAIMEVPCCSGLLQLVKMALAKTNRIVPVKLVKLSLQGKKLQEEWIQL